MTVIVKGYRELLRADARATKETKLGVRKALRQVAEPVRRDAEGLAVEQIRNMGRSPDWARMRTGVTTKVLYVAPRHKGVRGRGPRSRPNLAPLLSQRALHPALAQNERQVIAGFERMLDTLENNWAKG